MSTMITVGHYTRKHGSPISYDIETQNGAQRFISRVTMEITAIGIKRYIEQIDALPSYVQSRQWVAFTRATLARELQLYIDAKLI